MAVTVEESGIKFAIDHLGKVKGRAAEFFKAVADEILTTVIREGQANIDGGVMKSTGPNELLAAYFGSAMQANIRIEGGAVTTGLPVDEQNARILAFKEFGGPNKDWIVYPKQDRPNPHLRIPLPPALTPAGFDRYPMLLRNLPKSQNPFKIVRSKKGQAFLAMVPGYGKSKKGKGELWYVLAKKSQRSPHKWWTATIRATEAALPDIVDRNIGAFGENP